MARSAGEHAPSPRSSNRGGARRPAQQKESARKALEAPLSVIGVGASAGGLDALRQLLEAVPPSSGLAFVVIQHLDPRHESEMASLLASYTTLRVVVAEEGAALQPDTAYTLPPGRYLTLRDGLFHLEAPPGDGSVRMPIDVFFRSLAEDRGEEAVCIVLSGGGTDGTLGMRAVRAAGGLAIAQDPATAEADSMPRSAIATGLADLVLPPREMPEAILRYVREGPAVVTAAEGQIAPTEAEVLDDILEVLMRQRADFRGYKPATVLRRISRRMGVTRTGTLAEYLSLLRRQPEEVARLAKDLLIGVTSFFRDPGAYEELRRLVLAPLVREKAEGAPVRVWVAGCATGEEAYSLAILLLEEMSAAGRSLPIQIFASDVDSEALEFARAGVYPESIAADVSADRLARFFTRQEHGYRIAREIRDLVVFSLHNIITDPPFPRMDLVSCRNVLIYLGPKLQRRLTGLFSFSVRPGGHVFLGRSDTLAEPGAAFSQVSAKSRIYQRTDVPRHEMVHFPPMPSREAPLAVAAGEIGRRGADPMALAQRLLLGHFAAALVLVDRTGAIRYLHGDTGRYLRLPTGGPELNLFAIAKEGLPRRLRAAVRRAFEKNETVRIERAPVVGEEPPRFVDITVGPAGEPRQAPALVGVIFEDAQEAETARGAAAAREREAEDTSQVERLESELNAAREELRATTVEHEAANEELRAAHEESVSMNEELRATNEELETSKEEVQAVNEELNTLNLELKERIEQLNRTSADLANLLTATEIATIFLDREFRIRSFTPSATELFSLRPVDVGRPISDISMRFLANDLVNQAAQVLRDLTPRQQEVETPDGHWFLMRLLPYRAADGQVEGVVLTFANVTALKQAELASQWARIYAERIVATAREPLLVLDDELRVVSANPAFYRIFHLSPEQVQGALLSELGGGRWSPPALMQKLSAAPSGREGFEGLETEHEFPEVGRRVMLVSATPIEAEQVSPGLLLVAMEDITEERRRRQLAETLTAEVNHRTKNNLSIIASLLQLQADREPPDSASAHALHDAVTRVHSFAALHEQVQSVEEEEVEVVTALRRIAEMARRSLAVGEAEVSVEGDPYRCSFQCAANLGLIANELITNALKYGAPDETGALQVRVALGTEDGSLRLSVWNSGTPIAEGFDPSAAPTTGLYLVRGLAADHYGGEFRLQPQDGGTLAQVLLPADRLRQSP
jgi:two-component system CheB/CheR fusion protein